MVFSYSSEEFFSLFFFFLEEVALAVKLRSTILYKNWFIISTTFKANELFKYMLNICNFMNKTLIRLNLVIVSLLLIIGCVPDNTLYDNLEAPQKIDDFQPSKTILHFTFVNERQPDRNVKVTLNGEVVFIGTLEFKLGILKKVDFETTEGIFSFEVVDLTINKKEITTIDTTKGSYVAVSFFGDTIIIEQSKEEKIRID